MIVLDTNLLVYAHRRTSPQHHGAKQAIEKVRQLSSRWGITGFSCSEFWSVTTHPTLKDASTPHQAAVFLRFLWDRAGAEVCLPKVGFMQRLLVLSEAPGVRGAGVFDLQIGLCALEAGARELWTNDMRFPQLDGLKVVNPLLLDDS